MLGRRRRERRRDGAHAGANALPWLSLAISPAQCQLLLPAVRSCFPTIRSIVRGSYAFHSLKGRGGSPKPAAQLPERRIQAVHQLGVCHGGKQGYCTAGSLELLGREWAAGGGAGNWQWRMVGPSHWAPGAEGGGAARRRPAAGAVAAG